MKAHLEIYNYSRHDPTKRDAILDKAWKDGWSLQQILKKVRSAKPSLPVLPKRVQLDRIGNKLVYDLNKLWEEMPQYVRDGELGGRMEDKLEKLSQLYAEVDGYMGWNEDLINGKGKKRKRDEDEEEEGEQEEDIEHSNGEQEEDDEETESDREFIDG